MDDNVHWQEGNNPDRQLRPSNQYSVNTRKDVAGF